jgi:hypothetical protein
MRLRQIGDEGRRALESGFLAQKHEKRAARAHALDLDLHALDRQKLGHNLHPVLWASASATAEPILFLAVVGKRRDRSRPPHGRAAKEYSFSAITCAMMQKSQTGRVRDKGKAQPHGARPHHRQAWADELDRHRLQS